MIPALEEAAVRDTSRVVPAVLKPGECSIHHLCTAHGGGPNEGRWFRLARPSGVPARVQPLCASPPSVLAAESLVDPLCRAACLVRGVLFLFARATA